MERLRLFEGTQPAIVHADNHGRVQKKTGVYLLFDTRFIDAENTRDFPCGFKIAYTVNDF